MHLVNPHNFFLLFSLFFLNYPICFAGESNANCDAVPNPYRLDCHPEPMATQEGCLRRNCCWSLVDRDRTIACYFPDNYPTYKATGTIVRSDCGFSISAKRSPGAYSVPPDPIDEVLLEVFYETETRVRVRITDAHAKRWEPSINLSPPDPLCPQKMKYSVGVDGDRLGFSVSRVDDDGKQVELINSTGLMASAFVYANQFIQMAFRVRATHGYGLGEREDTFPMEMHEWKRMVFWARDDVPRPNTNLYGVHNFFLGLAFDGTAFGMFFLNSNAMEVTKQPLPSLTFRAIGGILDFFVFVGPKPTDVVAQYYQLIGYPPLPPYWALGFQLSRYGYSGVEEIRDTIERNHKAHVPQDVQWLDIDYMDDYRDWTLSKKDGFKGLAQFVKTELRDKYGIRTVIIVDAGIPTQAGSDYAPYQKGLASGVFINSSQTGQPIEGCVWPGKTVYPDFTKNETAEWWYECARDFQEQLHYDGLWIDMNEPSNFVDGSQTGCSRSNPLDYPPYTPQVSGNNLFFRTICPSALHSNGVPHYNLHNIYALHMAQVTRRALERINPGKRPFLLTRSSFAGAGRYTAHWSGDVMSTWSAMAASIPQMINFNLFAMPFFGADICGFVDNTTKELCVRWSQLGAFYPFSRNHNAIGARTQDPATWSDDAQKAIVKALDMRYQLLPYLYTLLHGAKNHGEMVVKALAFDYPNDLSTHHNGRQFLLGSCLNVAPVLAEGMNDTPVYLPQGEWVEFSRLARYCSWGKLYSVYAPLDTIPVFYKAGCILPMHPTGAMNTQEARKLGIGVTVILLNGTAHGTIVWDDGETEDGEVLDVTLSVLQRNLTAKATIRKGGRYGPIGAVPLAFIRIIGVTQKPSIVLINGSENNFTFYFSTNELMVTKFRESIDIKYSWDLTWN